MELSRTRRAAVMGDVVTARLEALVADIAPRRARPDPVRSPAGAVARDPEPTVDDGSSGGLGDAEAAAADAGWPDALDEPDAVGEPDDGGEPDAAGVGRWPVGETGRRVGARTLGWLVDFGRAHATAVAVVALVGLIWAAWSIFQVRTIPVATPVASAIAVATPTSSPSPSPVLLRVHVLGAVAEPGVVAVVPGARVEDAIAAAGGFAERARPGELNLAAPVVDGSQIVVGDTDAPGGEVRTGEPAGAAASSSGTVNLNSASAEQLETLPGVGPVTAQAILGWRSQHGRFSRVEELQEVDGIGPKTFQRLAPLVAV